MSLDDDATTGKYDADFPVVVRSFLRPPVVGWGPTYTDEAAIEQALRRAYHQGRMDGVSSVLKPDAPRAPETPEETFETVDEAWERLGLFEAASACPGPVSAVLGTVTLEPIGDRDVREWMLAEAKRVLGISLIEADEFVSGLLEEETGA